MKRLRIEFSPEAARQVELIDEWWRTNRLAAPQLFATELERVVRHLRRLPNSGAPYPTKDVPLLRRLLLPNCGHHVYYAADVDTATIRVYAVWHTARGRGPEWK